MPTTMRLLGTLIRLSLVASMRLMGRPLVGALLMIRIILALGTWLWRIAVLSVRRGIGIHTKVQSSVIILS